MTTFTTNDTRDPDLHAVTVAHGWSWRADTLEAAAMWPDGISPRDRHGLALIARDLFERLALRSGVDVIWWTGDATVVAIDPPARLPDLDALRGRAVRAVWDVLAAEPLDPSETSAIYDAACGLLDRDAVVD